MNPIRFSGFENEYDRRKFLSFLGRASAGAWAITHVSVLVSGCSTGGAKVTKDAFSEDLPGLPKGFRPLQPSLADELEVSPGLRWDLIIKRGDSINEKGEHFGSDCDFIAYTPDPKSVNSDEGMLWVNHEAFTPLFVSEVGTKDEKGMVLKSRANVLKEMNAVGGSLVRVKRESHGKWKAITPHPQNRRLNALTKIPFDWHEPIMGAKVAVGTLANCCGGKTPWGTILTCEENYQEFYGDVSFKDGKRVHKLNEKDLGWSRHFQYPPEHYGWVVEVNPWTGSAKKLISMGRFAHEGATVHRAKNGKLVAYMGDDLNDCCIYKFISDSPHSLSRGTLYVANTEEGKWIPLDLEKNPNLRKHFSSQTELLIRTREAAVLAGGTPQNRPEDIEIDPVTQAVFVALTNNKNKKDNFGSLLKIVEKDGDHSSLEFHAESFLAGGPKTGFSCPDNLAFDHKGNLWFTSDVSTASVGKKPYDWFGNNSLFYLPLSGPQAGKVFRVAVAPKDAEFTGVTFSPGGESLFMSVQHPGESSESLDKLTSHWPEGGKSVPQCGVVSLTGSLFL